MPWAEEDRRAEEAAVGIAVAYPVVVAGTAVG